MICKKTIKIKKSLLERLNTLLSIDDLTNLTSEEQLFNPKANDFIPVLSVTFANGNILDIDVCSDNTNYYNNCVLKDRNGYVLTCFDCCYNIEKEMEFTYGSDDIYIVVLDIE